MVLVCVVTSGAGKGSLVVLVCVGVLMVLVEKVTLVLVRGSLMVHRDDVLPTIWS